MGGGRSPKEEIGKYLGVQRGHPQGHLEVFLEEAAPVWRIKRLGPWTREGRQGEIRARCVQVPQVTQQPSAEHLSQV